MREATLLLAFLLASVVPSGDSFNCTPIRVWDGDGPIWCKEGPRIRLSGISTREIDESCKPNHPCPKASGSSARNHLAGLIGSVTGKASEGHLLVKGPVLRCRSVGNGKGSRTAAWCVSPKSGDLSCRMVRDGFALRWAKYWKDHRC